MNWQFGPWYWKPWYYKTEEYMKFYHTGEEYLFVDHMFGWFCFQFRFPRNIRLEP